MKTVVKLDLTGMAVLLGMLALITAAAHAATPAAPPASTDGINNIIGSDDAYAVSHSGFWKFRSPKITKPFGNQDALELAKGKHVDSNGCKVLWIAHGGDMLCFSTLAHRETFLRAPESYTQHALAFSQKSH